MSDYCGPIRNPTKDLIHISFAERTFQLPPSDPPITVSESESYHRTIKLAGGGTFEVKDKLRLLGGVWSSEWKVWLFQEVESASTADSSNEANRGRWREFVVPSTVPAGTHDALLNYLGGIQRVDLPRWVRIPGEAAGDEGDDGEEEEPPRRLTRAEVKRREELGDARKRVAEQRKAEHGVEGGEAASLPLFNSKYPRVMPVECRVSPSLEKGMTGGTLTSLLKARDLTRCSGTKAAQCQTLRHSFESDCYHTRLYRVYVYNLVKSGTLVLFKLVNPATVGAEVATTEEALKQLPWDSHGTVHGQIV